jgi:hypothetical protein
MSSRLHDRGTDEDYQMLVRYGLPSMEVDQHKLADRRWFLPVALRVQARDREQQSSQQKGPRYYRLPLHLSLN